MQPERGRTGYHHDTEWFPKAQNPEARFQWAQNEHSKSTKLMFDRPEMSHPNKHQNTPSVRWVYVIWK